MLLHCLTRAKSKIDDEEKLLPKSEIFRVCLLKLLNPVATKHLSTRLGSMQYSFDSLKFAGSDFVVIVQIAFEKNKMSEKNLKLQQFYSCPSLNEVIEVS